MALAVWALVRAGVEQHLQQLQVAALRGVMPWSLARSASAPRASSSRTVEMKPWCAPLPSCWTLSGRARQSSSSVIVAHLREAEECTTTGRLMITRLDSSRNVLSKTAALERVREEPRAAPEHPGSWESWVLIRAPP